MKKINLVIGFAIMGLFLNACSPAYVETEPTYIAVVRPASPGPNYV